MPNAFVCFLFLVFAAFTTEGLAQKSGKAAKSKDESVAPSTKKFYQYKSRSSRASDDLDEAERQKTSDPEVALEKVQDALAESIAQNNTFNEGRSYLLLGDINSNISEWKLAAQNYEKACNVLRAEYGSSNEFKNALTGLAKANLEAGNYDAAINNFTEVLSLKSITADELKSAELSLSEVYYRMGNYDKSLKIAQSINVQGEGENRSQQQSLLAKNFARKNDLGNARGYLDSVLAKPSAAPVQSAKEEVADVLRENKLYDDEIALRNRSIESNASVNAFRDVTKDKVELSKALEAKGATSEAVKELIEAAAIADTINDPHDQATAYLSLAGLYERNGRNNEALQAYRKYSKAVQKAEAETNARAEERSRIILKQNEIDELSQEFYVDRSEDDAQRAIIQRQRIVIASLTGISLLIGVASFFIYRSAQSSRRANQLLALKSLRSQMNPHFIFNALNSVNHFIAQQDERTANKFLSEFSQLMRLVLEYSQEDFITLQKEQEILTLYMKLEHYRFRDKFDYEIEIDETINAESISVPPMLIQPYLENAVWHGLRYRESVGFLKLSMKQQDSRLIVTITDNGIGRKKSAELKTENQKKHRSTGLKNIRERLSILNNVYRTRYEVVVSDGPDGIGTVVEISLPINNVKS
jgi:tetratricopeptide (TPR) repeat protein